MVNFRKFSLPWLWKFNGAGMPRMITAANDKMAVLEPVIKRLFRNRILNIFPIEFCFLKFEKFVLSTHLDSGYWSTTRQTETSGTFKKTLENCKLIGTITTILEINPAVIAFTNQVQGSCLIVVGDKKTPLFSFD